MIGLLYHRLSDAGISCELRNEFLSSSMVSAPFDPELWILRDEQFAEARELVAAWREPAPTSEMESP